MHVWIQIARVDVYARVGCGVPIDGQLHIGKILLKRAFSGVNLKCVPMTPARSPVLLPEDARQNDHS